MQILQEKYKINRQSADLKGKVLILQVEWKSLIL